MSLSKQFDNFCNDLIVTEEELVKWENRIKEITKYYRTPNS